MSTYDPFSYGQIKLGGDNRPRGESPEDLLFDEAGPGRPAAKRADSDWELPRDEPAAFPGGEYGAAQFGEDVLGETMAAAAPKRAQPVRPSVQPAAPKAPAAPARAPAAAAAAPVERLPAPRPAPAGRRAVRPHSLSSRTLATLLPSAMIACGGSATAWLYAMEHNAVMAGIVGVTALVGAAFLRVLFRG